MMLPAGMATTTISSRIVSPATTSATSGSRTGRLRGLSYLRHYTHGHHSNSSSSSAAPANHVPPVTTTITTVDTPTTRSTTTTTTTSTSTSTITAAAAAADTAPSPTPRPPAPPRQTRSTSPLNNAASNSWIPSTRLYPQIYSPCLSATPSPVMAGTVPATASTEPLPSIRFTPYIDLRSNRESLHFAPIERTLRHRDERIKVGRSSERDANNPTAPVGFSSKVVSRRHCEFWCDNGQWHVKDVKSSSGTFLNHIRLSAPGMESKAYILNDGDILQLGIDFKGGEEQIFRCVKIRVELNRAWQKSLNNFNMSAHRRLRNLAKGGKDPDSRSVNSSECAICLFPVAPCQSLFVAPCSHVWHYKCIRPLVEKEYPTFLCPNCRAVADLDRDIEEDEFTTDDKDDDNNAGLWEAPTQEALAEPPPVEASPPSSSPSPPPPPPQPITVSPAPNQLPPPPPPPPSPPPPPPPPTTPPPLGWRHHSITEEATSSSSDTGSSNGPMTPRNDVGPFVLDGADSRGRRETLFLPLGPGEL